MIHVHTISIISFAFKNYFSILISTLRWCITLNIGADLWQSLHLMFSYAYTMVFSQVSSFSEVWLAEFSARGCLTQFLKSRFWLPWLHFCCDWFVAFAARLQRLWWAMSLKSLRRLNANVSAILLKFAVIAFKEYFTRRLVSKNRDLTW